MKLFSAVLAVLLISFGACSESMARQPFSQDSKFLHNLEINYGIKIVISGCSLQLYSAGFLSRNIAVLSTISDEKAISGCGYNFAVHPI